MAFLEARTPDEALKTVAAAAGGAERAARMPAHERARVLAAAAAAVRADADAWARLICEEVAKPLKAARVEVERAAFTFSWAAGEAVRWGGPWLPLDAEPSGDGRLALVRRVPRGPALFITPFNFPLNLAVHKVAPAVAVGAPFVLKPPPQAPRCARKLAETLSAAGWPDECGTFVACPDDAAQALVTDERFATLSFTGSAAVGWRLKALAGRKHVVLELGGAACAVVCHDADLAYAAARCAAAGFGYAGQTCISVQRILVEAPAYEEFRDFLLANVDELKCGDPADPATDVGPLIDEKAAERVSAWTAEAAAGGGTLARGGGPEGRRVPPTVVEDPPAGCRLVTEEAFGPVVTLERVASASEALAAVAAGKWGLQAGVFTRDVETVLSAWDRVPVGGLVVNDVPSYRSDVMPYGGTKLSGLGREGVRWAMEELTEPRVLVLSRPG